ncbi:hypothetical protein VPH35_119262 [Triticum aestivum]
MVKQIENCVECQAHNPGWAGLGRAESSPKKAERSRCARGRSWSGRREQSGWGGDAASPAGGGANDGGATFFLLPASHLAASTAQAADMDGEQAKTRRHATPTA